MAQQEAPFDAETSLRKVGRADAIRSGGADTFRASGFHSADLDTTGNQPAAALTTPAAATGANAPAQTMTPGMIAAIQGGVHSGTGAKQVAGVAGGLASAATGVPFLGSVASALTSKNAPTWATVLGGPLIGNLFKKNASPLQDIAAAMQQGIAIKDSDWAKAGYGPGGAALAPAPQPTTPAADLRAVNHAGFRIQPNIAPMTGLRSI